MAEQIPPNPRWVTALNRSRPLFWVALAVNLAFAVLVVMALRAGSGSGWCTNAQLDAGKCTRNIGEMVGPWWLLFVWVVVDLVIGVMWWFTRPTRSR